MEKKHGFQLNLYGKHHIANIILAIKIGEMYQISYENIVTAIHEFKPVEGRMNLLKNKKRNIMLMNDAYSCSSIDAVKLGLETVNKINNNRKIAVLGRMEALGDQAIEKHEELGKFFESLNFDYLYITGGFKKYLAEGAKNAFKENQIKKFKTTEKLITALDENLADGDLIYVKGANTQNFNRIINHIKEKYEVK